MQSRNPLQTDNKAIKLDYSGMMSEVIGSHKGITPEEIDELVSTAKAVVEKIDEKRDSGEYGFYLLPYDSATTDEVLHLSETYQRTFDDFVVLGIGGSALGAKTLFQSLCSPIHNLLSLEERNGVPRIHFLDNIDPVTMKFLLNYVNPRKTLFNLITKSGKTVETISQFLIVRKIIEDKLGKQSASEHLVITTGDKSSSLYKFAQKNNCPLLDIPENVGGRYSVLSPVGLFPAAIAGIDIRELLAGARLMDDRTRTLPVIVEVDEAAISDRNPDSLHLRPGMFVTVKIKGKVIDQAFVLPRHVVYPGDMVYTVEDDRLKIKPVSILRTYKDSVIVSEGLSDGEHIIKTPLSSVTDGMRVRIK